MNNLYGLNQPQAQPTTVTQYWIPKAGQWKERPDALDYFLDTYAKTLTKMSLMQNPGLDYNAKFNEWITDPMILRHAIQALQRMETREVIIIED